MSKDYKGYELIKEIADGNIKDGTTIGVFDLSVCDIFVTKIVYKDKKLLWLEGKFDTSYLVNPNCYFRIEEEQEEIDIQKIDELPEWIIRRNGEVTQHEGKRLEMAEKINQLVQAVKQLDKNIKEKQ